MGKEICISTTPHETRLAILEDDQLAEIYYERENEYTLAGSIYKGRVTRVLPGMQSSFVDVGLERDAFLYVTDFLEDSEDQDEYETSSAGGRPRAERQPVGEEAAASPAAEERGERRGRRGRGGRTDRTDRTDQQPTASVEAAPDAREPGRRSRANEERAAVAAALKNAQPEDSDRAEKGDAGESEDGSPEGTRRWRGRRGRRRGGMRAGVLGGSPAAAGEDVQPATAPFDLPEHGAPGGLAAPTAGYTADEQEAAETFDLQASSAAVQREQRPDRGRDRNARSEELRESRSGRGAEQHGSPAMPAAIVLPGESISKYGVTAPAETAPRATAKLALPTRPVNYTPPRPATQIESIEGWDGGSVLPGESLSRHKSQPAPAQASHADPAAAAALVGLDQVVAESGREDASKLEERDHVLETSQPPAAAEVLEHHAEAASASPAPPETVAEAIPGAERAEQFTTTAQPVAAAEQTAHAVMETDPPAATEASLETTLEAQAEEYEPKDGEAAARLSPPNTSELRLSQLFGIGGHEPEKVAVTPNQHDQPVQTPVETPAEALHNPSQAEQGRSTVEAGNDSGYEHAAAFAEPQVERNAAHEVQQAREWQPEPAEEPNRSVLHAGLEAAPAPERIPVEDKFTELVDQLHGFAPGAGFLEEEVIDEDEYDFDPIHAHADEHDLEDLEEETLDGETGAGHGSEPDQLRQPLHMRQATHDHAGQQQDHPHAMDEDEEEDEDSSAFAFEVVSDDDEEDEAQPAAANGEPQRRERTADDRGRRGGRNGGGRRRGIGGGGGRGRSAQTQDLPIISDLLKQGQEILVQIAKEPIAKKGARITSHIALPGRFLVFMPTVGHVGVSRKIESDAERQRLKRILVSEKGDFSGGFIVRTAAEGASEEELRADLRFLINLWSEIKQRADTAKAPALIYHDLNLVERILRDQVSSNFSTIWVDTEQEYERIVRFVERFQPSLVRRVKLYTKETPLFEHFGIQEEISKALKSKVWLRSGGSIVINQTEALVAIDINTGKYVGKTARLEDTIVKTNLDAIPEIVRQIRLRDLGGIIVIDFIDMDERKNRHRVLAALEEAMKVDRAPSKVLQFNDFGLVAITRKRVKQSLERTLSVQCEVCAGTGMVKSPVTVCNEIFIELRKMQKHLDGKDVMLRVHPEVVKQLKGGNGRWINEYEEMVGKTIIIKSDPALHPEQFDIH